VKISEQNILEEAESFVYEGNGGAMSLESRASESKGRVIKILRNHFEKV
jgi:hypothetical protein